jgi:hypothetical protein
MLLFLLKTTTINLNKLVSDEHIDMFQLLHDKKIISNYKDLFKTACSKGYLQFAKWILTVAVIDVHMDCDYPFYYSCLNGHLETAKWIFSIGKRIIFKDNLKYIFGRCCEHGYIDVAIWLKEIFDVDIHAMGEYPFRAACANNHFPVVEWLLSIDKEIDISALNDNAFSSACVNGYGKMAQWIYKLKGNISIDTDNYAIFKNVCTNGHIEVAKWLLLISNIMNDENFNWNQLFACICSNNNYDAAHWLFYLKKDIAISYNNYSSFVYAVDKENIILVNWLYELDNGCVNSVEAFITSCKRGNLKLSRWIQSFNPDWDISIIQQSFISAIKEGHLNILEWLFSLEYQIDIRSNEEFCFRTAAECGYTDIILWLFAIDPNINIRAKDDFSFVRACRRNHKSIAIWLSEKCKDYYIETDGWMVSKYRINNRLHISYDLLLQDKYDEAINLLDIHKYKKINLCDNDSMFCCICQDYKERIIETECCHNFCLECLLSWYIYKNSTQKFPCAYCRSTFELENCTSINCISTMSSA